MADHTHLVRTRALGVPLRGRFRRCGQDVGKVPCSGDRLGGRSGYRLGLSPSLPLRLIHASVRSLWPADDGPVYVSQAWVTCCCVPAPSIDLGAVQEQRNQEGSHFYDIAQPREHQCTIKSAPLTFVATKLMRPRPTMRTRCALTMMYLHLAAMEQQPCGRGGGQQKFEGKQLQGAS